MARFGFLYLNHGLIDNYQLISKEWLDQSTNIQIPFDYKVNDDLSIYVYGYNWFIGKIHSHNVIYSSDARGQFLIIVPDKKIIIVTLVKKLNDSKKIANFVTDIIQTIK